MATRTTLALKGTSQWMKMKVEANVDRGKKAMKHFVISFLVYFTLDFFVISNSYNADASAVRGIIAGASLLLCQILYKLWVNRKAFTEKGGYRFSWVMKNQRERLPSA